MELSRRAFLGHGLALGSLRSTGRASLVAPVDDPVLVVLQVRGGWDYLGMLVPTEDPTYHALRPALAIGKREALPVQQSSDLGWHPAMCAYRALFDRGELAVVQNVSHAFPDLSHSESEAKWHTADPKGGDIRTGWLGRALARMAWVPEPFPALTIDTHASQSFAGSAVPALRRLEAMKVLGTAREIDVVHACAKPASQTTRVPLVGIARQWQRALTASEQLIEVGAAYRPMADYPDCALSGDLQTCARLITGGRRTRVYFLTTVGFDTHSQQCEPDRPTVGTFAWRLRELCDATAAFLDDLRAHGQHRRVVILLYSEFGRSVHENRVLGTEHGHGGVAFVAGSSVRGGLYGEAPDLASIRAAGTAAQIAFAIPFDRRATDYRRVQATLLERWLGVASEPVLQARFEAMGFL